jgi:3',5'-cyclic-AMP phosphodiesterase
MKLVLLSDLHIGAAPFHGRDPLALLRRAIAHIRAEHSDAEAVLLLGDLTETGAPRDYAVLRDALGNLGLPVHITLGNHDDRGAFHAVFGGAGFASSTQVIAGQPCHLFDTLDPGRVGGSLDGGRMEWLEAALAAAVAPGFLFMHHPPIHTFVPAFDRDGLAGRDALAATLDRQAGKLRALFFGHCHLPLAGMVAGIPAFCVPSLFHQSRPVFSRPEYRANPALPPGYGVLFADRAGLALHAVGFSDLLEE